MGWDECILCISLLGGISARWVDKKAKFEHSLRFVMLKTRKVNGTALQVGESLHGASGGHEVTKAALPRSSPPSNQSKKQESRQSSEGQAHPTGRPRH